MTDTPDNRPHNTHAARRVKYGLNITVAIVAALVLAVLLNWIAYRQTYARMDLTATGVHSLAPQTQRVLAGLEGEHRIVTLFGDDLPELTRIRDLADEYDRRSGDIRVEHLNPELDVQRRLQLHADVHDHFADELDPYVQTVDAGMAALRALSERMPPLTAKLAELLEDDTFPAGRTREQVQQVNAVLGGQQAMLANRAQALEEARDQSLPDYMAIKQTVQQLLESESLDQGLFGTAVRWFERAADDDSVPGRVRNTLLEVNRELEAMRDLSRSALRELRLAEPPRRYDEARQGLSLQQTVVVIGPEQLRVIPAGEMYRGAGGQGGAGGGDEVEVQFLGEERLTGTLIAMGLEQPPMVVFVNSGSRPAIGRGGLYSHVAERLQSADVRVEQWSPGGRMSSTGQPLPAGNAPKPEPGQRTVWVVLPVLEQNPMAGASSKADVARLLEERLAAGDAAMMMLMLDPMASMGVGDPLVDLVRDDWGIRPQLDRQILHEQQHGGGQSTATGQFGVDDWPDALPITQALAGMQGIFVQTSPLATGPAEGVEHWPVVELTSQRMWAPRNVSAENLRAARYDPAEAEERYTIALAAERESGDAGRLMVITDRVWASDMVTTIGLDGQAGTAGRYGYLFPANSELFVNSVYWLAGLEGLIAASPRTQDIRRIEAMSDTTLRGYYLGLLGGVPVVILASGLTVWFVRRRG
ncbi:MAG: hypothetical protein WD151_05445 [Phycisphaeraceae bacterium]